MCVCVYIYIYIYIYAYVDTRLTKTWTAINRLSIIWKSDFYFSFALHFKKFLNLLKK